MERIRKGDTVVVIAGKDKGKRGKVLRILTDKNRVVIERIAMIKKHMKPKTQDQKGGIIEMEGSVHLSNVMPVDAGSDKRTRVKVKLDNGARRRVAKSGTTIEAAKE